MWHFFWNLPTRHRASNDICAGSHQPVGSRHKTVCHHDVISPIFQSRDPPSTSKIIPLSFLCAPSRELWESFSELFKSGILWVEVHDDHQVLCSCSFFIFHFSFSGSRLRLLKLLTGVEDAILQFLSPAPFLESQINGDVNGERVVKVSFQWDYYNFPFHWSCLSMTIVDGIFSLGTTLMKQITSFGKLLQFGFPPPLTKKCFKKILHFSTPAMFSKILQFFTHDNVFF